MKNNLFTLFALLISVILFSACTKTNYVGKYESAKIVTKDKIITNDEYKLECNDRIGTAFQFEILDDNSGYIRLDSDNIINFKYQIKDDDKLLFELEPNNSQLTEINGYIEDSQIQLKLNDSIIYFDKTTSFEGDLTLWGEHILCLAPSNTDSLESNNNILESNVEPETNTAIIPDITNYSESDAIQSLKDSGFIPKVHPIYDNNQNIEIGNVVKTEPTFGTEYPINEIVIVYIKSK